MYLVGRNARVLQWLYHLVTHTHVVSSLSKHSCNEQVHKWYKLNFKCWTEATSLQKRFVKNMSKTLHKTTQMLEKTEKIESYKIQRGWPPSLMTRARFLGLSRWEERSIPASCPSHVHCGTYMTTLHIQGNGLEPLLSLVPSTHTGSSSSRVSETSDLKCTYWRH